MDSNSDSENSDIDDFSITKKQIANFIQNFNNHVETNTNNNYYDSNDSDSDSDSDSD